MFHLELFSSAIPLSGANNFQQLNYFKTDNILPPLNLGMQVSGTLANLMWLAGVGANLVHIRAQAPSMLPFPYPALSPNNRGLAFESPPRVWDLSSYPLPLRPTEEFDLFCTQNSGAAQTEYVACQFTDNQLIPPPAGRYFSVHWTAAVALNAGAWTQVQPIFDQALPAGFYALVGARALSASALFFRLFPAMAPLWRPGGIAVQAYDQFDSHKQRGYDYLGGKIGPWGVWLSFYQNVPPQVEFFATAADAAEEGWFDLIQVSTATSIGTPG